MHPKYIIAGNRLTGKGYLRMGMVINHKDLVVGFEKVWGGGWWARDDEKKTVTLYGSSCDFGSADFRHLKLIDRGLKDYTFINSGINASVIQESKSTLPLSSRAWSSRIFRTA